MNVEFVPTFLFYASLSFLVLAIILLMKGSIVFGLVSLFFSALSIVVWLFAGFFAKFDSSPQDDDSNSSDVDDNEGKGVLKPF